MPGSLRKRDRLIYGVILPVGIMVLGLVVIMNAETGAGAAEFASLARRLWPLVVAVTGATVYGGICIVFLLQQS